LKRERGSNRRFDQPPPKAAAQDAGASSHGGPERQRGMSGAAANNPSLSAVNFETIAAHLAAF
jgi:hypothetical protein